MTARLIKPPHLGYILTVPINIRGGNSFFLLLQIVPHYFLPPRHFDCLISSTKSTSQTLAILHITLGNMKLLLLTTLSIGHWIVLPHFSWSDYTGNIRIHVFVHSMSLESFLKSGLTNYWVVHTTIYIHTVLIVHGVGACIKQWQPHHTIIQWTQFSYCQQYNTALCHPTS